MNGLDYKNIYVDVNTFDVETISYNKPILFYKVNRNMGIYYKKEIPENTNITEKKSTKNTKKQKIIFQTPKMVVPFDIKEFKNEESGKSTYKMCLSFSTLTNLYNEDEIKHFYQFMKKIDTVNEETIMAHKKEWGLPSKIEYKKSIQRLNKDFPPSMGINLPHDEKLKFLFKVYDENALESNISIIDKKSIVSVVLELTDLRFSDTDFRANWTVLQIRKFKPYSSIQEFFMSRCFIYDSNDAENKANQELIEHNKKMQQLELYKMQQIQQIQQMQQAPIIPIIPITPIQPVAQPITSNHFVPPSKHDLLNGLKMLKKTITIDKSKSIEGKIIDSIETEPKPKKLNKIIPPKNKSDTNLDLDSSTEIKINKIIPNTKNKLEEISNDNSDVKTKKKINIDKSEVIIHATDIKTKKKINIDIPEVIIHTTDVKTKKKININIPEVIDTTDIKTKKKTKSNIDKSEEMSSAEFDPSSESEHIPIKKKSNKKLH